MVDKVHVPTSVFCFGFFLAEPSLHLFKKHVILETLKWYNINVHLPAISGDLFALTRRLFCLMRSYMSDRSCAPGLPLERQREMLLYHFCGIKVRSSVHIGCHQQQHQHHSGKCWEIFNYKAPSSLHRPVLVSRTMCTYWTNGKTC